MIAKAGIEGRTQFGYHALMPELPEVESVIRGLEQDLIGRRICQTECFWERTISGIPVACFAEAIAGCEIHSLSRRAKYIILQTDAAAIVIHLRMTGRLYVSEPAEQHEADRWLRVSFMLEDGRQLRFSDLRKFGRIYWVEDLTRFFAHLGPEPLSDDFGLTYFQNECSRRNKSLKGLLLDQKIIAGIGNIYADESCFLAGVHPARRANSLTRSEVSRIHRYIRDVLLYAIRYEGASFQWYRKPDGSSGNMQTHFYVFNRAGEHCRSCTSSIVKIRHLGRGTYFCPHCQPLPANT